MRNSKNFSKFKTKEIHLLVMLTRYQTHISVTACAQDLADVGATIREATDYFLQNRFAEKGVVTALVAANDF